MKNIKEQLSEILQKAFMKCGFENCGTVVACDLDIADYQCNDAMPLAKTARKAPMLIAKDIINAIEPNDIIEIINIAGAGFINIVVSKKFVANAMNEYMQNVQQNIAQKHQKQKIVLDYGGANIAKPLHIGHLRPAIIGECLKRLARFLGDEVIGDVHLGDWGLQMGMVIAEIQRRQPDLVFFDENYEGEYPKASPVNIEDLETLYPEASKRAKEDEQVMEIAHKATYDLQNGRRGYVELWKRFCQVSIDACKENYNTLDVSFDLWNGESTCNDTIQPMVEKLKADGFAYESNGATVVNVSLPDDNVTIPPFLVIKSDGAALYSTTDLATIIDRQNQFNPDQIWYVVDNRQSLHFTQLFRCAYKTGIRNENTTYSFVGFGTINGKDGKPYKTRAGGTMKLCDFIAEIKEEAKIKVESNFCNREDLNKSELENIKNCVAIATLKFADLSNYRAKDYIFDISKFMEFEGKTGPYLLYTFARMNSLIEKNKDVNIQQNFEIYSNLEKEIILTISSAEEYMLKAYEDKAPSYLCEVAYKLANLYNSFYANNNILKEQDENKRSSWIKLSTYTQNTLKMLLDLLGIKTVNKM